MSMRIFLRILLTLAIVAGLVAGLWFAPQASAAEGGGLARAVAAQEKHNRALMGRKGVVGTAVGVRQDGQYEVRVYVKKAQDRAGVPKRLDGIPVMAEVTGEIRALGDTTLRYRPAPIGVSTGHPDITAGTIGERVTDGTNVYALSNNHVYANENKATLGDNVLQPGPYDGGANPADAIGTLAAFAPIAFDGSENVIDAAIALSSRTALSNATLGDGYGIPDATTAAAVVRMKVRKYGRTTQLTNGRVDAVNATVNVGYDSGTARFVRQIIIKPGKFSAGGDSGSLIVTQDGNHPVGLLFAGSSLVTIANPIDEVLSHFGVSIDATVVTGSIAGTVTDSATGAPLANAAVSTDSGQETKTDANGNYTLSAVPVGNRTVTAGAAGYVSQEKQATVTEGMVSEVNFALAAEPIGGGTGAIKGTVTDAQSGARLGGVLVETDTGQSAATNPAGKYGLRSVPEGERTVTASKSGYVAGSRQVSVAADGTSTANFALQPE